MQNELIFSVQNLAANTANEQYQGERPPMSWFENEVTVPPEIAIMGEDLENEFVKAYHNKEKELFESDKSNGWSQAESIEGISKEIRALSVRLEKMRPMGALKSQFERLAGSVERFADDIRYETLMKQRENRR